MFSDFSVSSWSSFSLLGFTKLLAALIIYYSLHLLCLPFHLTFCFNFNESKNRFVKRRKGKTNNKILIIIFCMPMPIPMSLNEILKQTHQLQTRRSITYFHKIFIITFLLVQTLPLYSQNKKRRRKTNNFTQIQCDEVIMWQQNEPVVQLFFLLFIF
jgi:hypothetical protein